MADITLRELVREAYGTLKKLRPLFDTTDHEHLFSCLCEIERPALSESLNGCGGSANLPVSFATTVDDDDVVSQLRTVIGQLDVAHEALMDAGLPDDALVFKRDAEKLRAALDDVSR